MDRTSRSHHFDQGVEQVCSTASGTTAFPSWTPFILPLWHFGWTSLSAQTSQLCSQLILWVQDRPSLRAPLARLCCTRLSARSTSSGAVGRVFPTVTKIHFKDLDVGGQSWRVESGFLTRCACSSSVFGLVQVVWSQTVSVVLLDRP